MYRLYGRDALSIEFRHLSNALVSIGGLGSGAATMVKVFKVDILFDNNGGWPNQPPNNLLSIRRMGKALLLHTVGFAYLRPEVTE
jgi:hypothetical protein